MPDPVYPDKLLKLITRHARLLPQVLFGGSTESLHCGWQHFKDLFGDGAVEVLPIKMPSTFFPLLWS